MIRGWSLNQAIARVKGSRWAVAQIVLASTLAYFIAREVLGHSEPLLAVTVTVSSLGFSRDTRPSRVLSTALAMLLGIAGSELLLLQFGTGVWQLTLALAFAALAARFISDNSAFAVTVVLQAALVQIIPEPEGGVFARSFDGAIGALVALGFTALLPRNPLHLARADAQKLFSVFRSTLTSLRLVLANPDVVEADAALERIRDSQGVFDGWKASLESALAISKISPFYRWLRPELEQQLSVMKGMDLATRNLRVLTRRIDFLIRDGKQRPALADLIAKLETGVLLLEQSSVDFSVAHQARRALRRIAPSLNPAGLDLTIAETTVLMLLRPLWVDLAIASGLDPQQAREMLPTVE